MLIQSLCKELPHEVDHKHLTYLWCLYDDPYHHQSKDSDIDINLQQSAVM